MTFRNLVIVNGEEKELKDFTPQEHQDMKDAWNRRAAEAANYKEIKTA